VISGHDHETAELAVRQGKSHHRSFSTLVELLQFRALSNPHGTAYLFLSEGETEQASVSFAQLDERARATAAVLQAHGSIGDRAVLLYPSGLGFISAFFGCLYAGIIPVPANPPRSSRHVGRLQALIADSESSIALTDQSTLHALRGRNLTSELAPLLWLETDALTETLSDDWSPRPLSGANVALLQYSSGSTGTPKGVIVSHRNLLHNEEMIARAFSHSDRTIFVGWLPLFHDMGLIGNVLQPLYLGILSVLMSPMAFLQQPARWLRAISRYRATTSGAPNFAYELCVQKVTAEQSADLDLSSWDVAYNGSEPVRADTLERFVARFAPNGFRRAAFYPCYGMAETTLLATAGDKGREFRTLRVDAEALNQDRVIPVESQNRRARVLVACGRPWHGTQLHIVDTTSGIECTEGQVGELWLSGNSVAEGYWHKPDETRETFRAVLGAEEGPFLRTGDLGFIHQGEVYITGRQKDLMIIRGRNHYPEDIEQSAQSSHPAVRAGSCAAFSVEQDGEERLVVAQEIDLAYRKAVDRDDVVKQIRRAIADAHLLRAHAVVLLMPRSLPKTSSGKVQRHECKRLFLRGGLSEFRVQSTITMQGRSADNASGRVGCQA
jgi:acyl-CoA synthetase (AMP-forming)/AMP-acid ligase II